MKNINFELSENGNSFAFEIAPINGGFYQLNYKCKIENKFIPCGAICAFNDAGKAFKWARLFTQYGGQWHAVNLANLQIFGAGELAA